MAVGERDSHTGHMTTGHEWDGIRELNTRVPRPVYFFLIVTAAFAVVYWLLMPAWPLGVTYTKGLLGIDQRKTVAEDLHRAAVEREVWTRQIEAGHYEEILVDQSLMRTVRETGATLFGDNCAVCHGARGEGGKAYPALIDSAWLWGGEPETIAETLRVGINSAHAETRTSQMLAFGRDQLLDRATILNVVAYVQSLSDPQLGSGPQASSVAAGEAVFAENCVTCHGADGTGSVDFGAPDLTDGFWIYGGDRQSIFDTVFNGRQGQMPSWEARLTALDRKILTLYVLDLGSARQ